MSSNTPAERRASSCSDADLKCLNGEPLAANHKYLPQWYSFAESSVR